MPNKQTNLSTSSRISPESSDKNEHESLISFAVGALDEPPGRGGHREEGEEKEGGVEQGEEVRMRARPDNHLCSKSK